jgi:hypothetical protein
MSDADQNAGITSRFYVEESGERALKLILMVQAP